MHEGDYIHWFFKPKYFSESYLYIVFPELQGVWVVISLDRFFSVIRKKYLIKNFYWLEKMLKLYYRCQFLKTLIRTSWAAPMFCISPPQNPNNQ